MADTVASAVLGIAGTNSGGAVVDALEEMFEGIASAEQQDDKAPQPVKLEPEARTSNALSDAAEEQKTTRTLTDFADARGTWMMQQGGLETLSEPLRASAERSYEKWPGDHGRMPLASYVEYVQQHWHKELNALGGADALETHLQNRETIRTRDTDTSSARTPPSVSADRIADAAPPRDARREAQERTAEPERPVSSPEHREPSRAARPREPFSAEGVLSAAHRRLSALERDAAEATTQGVEQSRAQRLPHHDIEPHRRELLHAATTGGPAAPCPPHLRPSLTKLDWQVNKIRQQIQDNPMWRSSAFLARQPSGAGRTACDFRTDREAQAAVPELRATLEQLKKAEAEHQRDLAASQKAIDRLESLQRATGPLAWFRRNVLKQEVRWTHKAELATSQEHKSEANRRRCEQRAKQLHEAYTNVQDHEKQAQRDVARQRLRELEEPLRKALLERLAVGHALQGGCARTTPDKLQVGEVLTCQAVHSSPGGFSSFMLLETERNERIALDLSEHPSLSTVHPGDQVRVRRDAHGSLDLAMHQRARGPDRIDGVVASISRDGDRIRELVVRNEHTGKEERLKPSNSRDLADDFPAARAALQQLREGDAITAQRGQRTLEVSRARDRGRGGR